METLRVHYCLDKPRDDGRCRARCGHWVAAPHYTDDHALVTCKACRKLLALPPHSKSTAMNKLSSILPFALLILAACGPAPADDLDGSTSSGDSTSGESTGSTGAESTGEGSTSEAADASSTGEGSTSGLTGGGASSSSGGESTSGDANSTGDAPWMGGSCWGQECDDAAQPCRTGLTCMEDPLHLGVKVCVADCVEGDDCRTATLVCGEIAPVGECRIDIAGGPRCFPITCAAVGDCPLGSTCDVDAGFCY